MKKFINAKRTLLSFFVVLLLLFSVCGSAFAVEPASGTYMDFAYTVESSDKVTINSYTGEETHVVIPGTINGKTVAYIAREAFKDNTTLKHLTISDNIVAIDKDAFSGCTSLERVLIPKSMETIKSNAFEGCSSLEKVYYCGTEFSWQKLDVPMLGNSDLLSAKIKFECSSDTNIANNFPVAAFVWIIVGVVVVGIGAGTFTYLRIRKNSKKTKKK